MPVISLILSFIKLGLAALVGYEVYREWKREDLKEKLYLAGAFFFFSFRELLEITLFSKGFLPVLGTTLETLSVALFGFAFLFPLRENKKRLKKFLLYNILGLGLFFLLIQFLPGGRQDWLQGGLLFKWWRIVLLLGIIYFLWKFREEERGLAVTVFILLLIAHSASGIGKSSFILISLLGLTLLEDKERERKILVFRETVQSLLKESETALSLLHRIGSTAVSTINLNKILSLVMESALKTTKASAGAVFLLGKDKKSLQVTYAEGLFPPLTEVPGYALTKEKFLLEKLKAESIKIGDTIIGLIAQSGSGVLIEDALADSRVKQTIPEVLKIRTMIAVPLKIEREVFGVISLINKGEEEFFNRDDYNLLDTLANQMVVTINNARVYERMQRDYFNTIRALSQALEAKDEYTRGHTDRVTAYSLKIGKSLELSKDEMKQLEYAAVLHDIGKLGIEEQILGKPGKLTKKEFDVVKEHPVTGERIVKSLDFLGIAKTSIRHHHERYDGEGYPDSLKGEDIPLGARIIAIADTFDAMTSDRPYRRAFPPEEAIKELKKVKGKQLDPEVVEAFLAILEKEGKSGGNKKNN
jgi:HD-GYP domain-containing protein (c-di-GMP phosphodiesterase class II)